MEKLITDSEGLSLEHYGPLDCLSEYGVYTHRLKLHLLEKCIGVAEMVYLNVSFPFYYLFHLGIDTEYRGRGLGSSLLVMTNEFLSRRNQTGILRNIIKPNNPTFSIYERYGWQILPENSDWMMFNAPEQLSKGQISKTIYEIRELEDDGTFYGCSLND